MKRQAFILPTLLLGLVLGALLVAGLRVSNWIGGADPETVASGTLQSVREQARLTPLAARFVAVVTSTQSRFGITARKTLIMPGLVRYEIDLARIRDRDLSWDGATKTLSIALPPLEIAGPEIDLAQVQEYGGGGLLTALTDAERVLDQANRQQARRELLRQAREAAPMRLARDAAKRAVARSFAMPLRAAGIDASVDVRFTDEPRQEPSYLDRSRSLEEVESEAKARRAREGKQP
ncbi:MAG TPA: DUF4230 domain-containing protein [Allosphingosinicella sp.]|nr:DUF4230 domain-containing protein [Allosphingosinicella sp.]